MQYDRAKRRKYYEQNAERICAYNRRYRQKRRLTHAKLAEQQNERNKLYQQTVKGQAALAAARLNTCAKKRLQRGKVTANDILNLPTHCQHCKKMENLQIDHVTPAMHGGLNIGKNLQRLCYHCHLVKTKREKAVRVDVVAVEPTQLELF